ncbi:unnamed protein product [Gongylonema pulchrum]|uniref:ARID domain-containing protein n=1 Tax=Gongylonema pulchrum TaxID=637853 RepID=A0A183DUG0_9BILA|nr:unnamed protein product [Gongylonema pulchrum]
MCRRKLERSRANQDTARRPTGKEDAGGVDSASGASAEDAGSSDNTGSSSSRSDSGRSSGSEKIPDRMKGTQVGRALRSRLSTQKTSGPQRSRNIGLRRASGTRVLAHKHSHGVRDLSGDSSSGNDNANNDSDDNETNEGGRKRTRICRFRQPPPVSRLIAKKILTKSIARTRKQRCSSALVLKENVTGRVTRRRADGVSGSNNDAVSDNSRYDDKVDSGDSGSGKSGENVQAPVRGKIRGRKRHCSTTDAGDEKMAVNQKRMDLTDSNSAENRKVARKRQSVPEKDNEPALKKRQRETDDPKKDYVVGSVVAVYEDSSRKGKWTPAVVVSERAFRTSAAKGSMLNVAKNDVLLRSFRDAKYFACAPNRLSQPGVSALRAPDSTSKLSVDRAVAFAEKDRLPMGWETVHIFDVDIWSKKSEARPSSSAAKTRPEAAKSKQEKEKERNSSASSTSSEDSSDEEYAQERDHFTAQLYKYHEERVGLDAVAFNRTDFNENKENSAEPCTPINRAPKLGGKDIDMFRLHNLVHRFGGKKKVNENNHWRQILRKLHLVGCPGATSATVKQAYSRLVFELH